MLYVGRRTCERGAQKRVRTKEASLYTLTHQSKQRCVPESGCVEDARRHTRARVRHKRAQRRVRVRWAREVTAAVHVSVIGVVMGSGAAGPIFRCFRSSTNLFRCQVPPCHFHQVLPQKFRVAPRAAHPTHSV